MNLIPGKKLTVVTREGELHEGQPLFQAILDLLRSQGFASVTVTRGIAGFSASGPIHTASIELLSFDLPLVIEASGVPEKIDRVVPLLAAMHVHGTVDIMPVEMVRTRVE